MWQHYLRKAQRERFLVKNLWEQLDEPLITKVLQHAEKGDVFIDCGVFGSDMVWAGVTEVQPSCDNPAPMSRTFYTNWTYDTGTLMHAPW